MANYFDAIDDFLLGKMSDIDRQDFETEMNKNADLSAAVAVHQLERRAVQLDMRDNLRAEMAKWRAEKKTAETTEGDAVETPVVTLNPEKGKVVPLSRRVFQWAAAAVILLAIGFFVLIPPKQSGLEIIQKGNFYDEPSFGQKGATDTSLIASAEKAIEQQKDYKKALSLLEQVRDTSLTIQSLEIKAHCHYKLGDFVAAAADWQKVINQNSDPLSKQSAEWHWLLMKLAANQRDAAFDNLLKQIEGDAQHNHQSEAIKLRKMLN